MPDGLDMPACTTQHAVRVQLLEMMSIMRSSGVQPRAVTVCFICHKRSVIAYPALQ